MQNLSPEMQTFINKHLLTPDVKKQLVTMEELDNMATLDVIKRYVALIILMSKQYAANYMIERDDLVMQGIIGLLDAIKRFDSSRSTNFHFLAIIRIKSEMYDYFLMNRVPITVPRYIAVVLSHIDVIRSILSSCISSRSTIQEIILTERMNAEQRALMPTSMYKCVLKLKGKIRNIAEKQANCSYGDIVKRAQEEFSFVNIEDVTLSEHSSRISTNPENEYYNKDLVDKISKSAKNITDKEKALDIIQMYLGGYDNTTIADRNRVSRGYVSHIVNSFLKELKRNPIYSEIQEVL